MRAFSALLLLTLSLASAPTQAQTITIKLGTMAPEGSPWHALLKEMGVRWAEVSGGKVKLKVFAGGVAGEESDMVRKLGVGQLGAATLTALGLHVIEDSPQAIATPGLITSQAEWDAVFPQMVPIWNQRFLAKGYVPIQWGDIGSIHMFFKRELRRPSQMKGVRTYAWAGDPASAEAWARAGLTPVVISQTDIPSSLASGMIESMPQTPLIAFTTRWFERARYMPDLAWGHLPGATIVSKRVWDQIPADLQPKLLAIAEEIGHRVDATVLKMQEEAIAQMKKEGLVVVQLTAAERAEWMQMAEKFWPVGHGGVCTPEAFEEVKRRRDAWRATARP